jgi:hypothetical protein
MRTSNLAAVALAALLGAGCAADDGGGTGSPDGAAAGLAVRAEGVAAALDAGRCDAALAEARALQTDLAAAELAADVRAEALAGAARVVNGIVCTPPPPPTTTTTAAPVVTARDSGGDTTKKGKGRKGDDDDD